VTLQIRQATADDAQECGRICHDAFAAIANRHGFTPDFPSVDAAVSAPVTVDPDAQDRHVGRALMNAVFERSAQQRAPGVRLLQSAYHNRSMCRYAKLGFDVREPFAVMHHRSDLVALIGAAGEFGGPGFLVPMPNTELLRWCVDDEPDDDRALPWCVPGFRAVSTASH
jgi:hypothetical protein